YPTSVPGAMHNRTPPGTTTSSAVLPSGAGVALGGVGITSTGTRRTGPARCALLLLNHDCNVESATPRRSTNSACVNPLRSYSSTTPPPSSRCCGCPLFMGPGVTFLAHSLKTPIPGRVRTSDCVNGLPSAAIRQHADENRHPPLVAGRGAFKKF